MFNGLNKRLSFSHERCSVKEAFCSVIKNSIIKNIWKIFLQTKIKKTNSSYKSALKMSFPSLSLSSVESKRCFKCERCQHDSAKLQKIFLCSGNLTLELERILFKEALNRIETEELQYWIVYIVSAIIMPK